MPVRLPPPLRRGDTIAVTAPSSGVPVDLVPRLEFAVADLRSRGYDVRLGECLDGSGVVSAPAQDRADELVAMLCDPEVAAVVPPWGGLLAIDLLDRLDWARLADAEPTWFVGYSDCTTVLLPLLTRLGWAGVHGANLMDSPYRPPAGLAHWTEVAARPAELRQVAPGRHRGAGFDRWQDDPTYAELTLDTPGRWSVVGPEPLDVSGRLVGGCVEVLGPLAGTTYGDVAGFGAAHADERLVVLLEASDDDAPTIARHLHGMRLAGWFDHASCVLVGRTRAPEAAGMTQRDAVLQALGDVVARGVPVVLDVDCGHVPPWTPMVLGAPTRVVADGGTQAITQTLV